jgi:hypothetical protein
MDKNYGKEEICFVERAFLSTHTGEIQNSV